MGPNRRKGGGFQSSPSPPPTFVLSQQPTEALLLQAGQWKQGLQGTQVFELNSGYIYFRRYKQANSLKRASPVLWHQLTLPEPSCALTRYPRDGGARQGLIQVDRQGSHGILTISQGIPPTFSFQRWPSRYLSWMWVPAKSLIDLFPPLARNPSWSFSLDLQKQ